MNPLSVPGPAQETWAHRIFEVEACSPLSFHNHLSCVRSWIGGPIMGYDVLRTSTTLSKDHCKSGSLHEANHAFVNVCYLTR